MENFKVKDGRITCTISAWDLSLKGLIRTGDTPADTITITFADVDTSRARYDDFLAAVRAGHTEYDWRAPIGAWRKGGEKHG